MKPINRRAFVATSTLGTAGMVSGLTWYSTPSAALAAEQKTGTSQAKLGTPIMTYWAGPPITEASITLMKNGGWNLIWCQEKELNMAQQHGLRAMLTDGLLSPQTLDDPARKAQLDALITRVRQHPALYNYFITDEPGAAAFPGLGKLVAYLREKDPAHFAYINLFPTYASNEQLGNKGDVVTAYKEHLRQYLDIVKPELISYDHYHFRAGGADGPEYFLNLGLIRQAALDRGLPFLNIVQACSWDPAMRIPNGRELRWLAYTSLAYGAQGLSYYVYFYPEKHNGMMIKPDGSPTALYFAAKEINPEFVAIATQLQPLKSLAVYHAGMTPPGTQALPSDAPFQLDPALPLVPHQNGKPASGIVLGTFGKTAKPTHLVVVNLDYQKEAETTVAGPSPAAIFNPATQAWRATDDSRIKLRLPPGSGKLIRFG